MFTPQTISRGIRWAVLGKLVGQLISWTSTIVVIRLLSPEDYGLVALAGVPIGLLVIVSVLGLDEVLVRRAAIDEDYQRRTLGALLLANSLLYGAVCLLSEPYATYTEAPRLSVVMPILALQLLIGCFGQVPAAVLERQLKIREITRVEITALITGAGISLALAYAGFGVWALVSATLANQLVRSTGLSLAAGSPPLPRFDMSPLLKELSFAGNVLANRVAWYLTQALDDLLIGKFLGQQTLGYYSVGKHFASLPLQKIAGTVHQIAFPSIAHGRDDSHRRDLILKGLSLICFVTFPVYFAMAAVAEPLTLLLFGDKWAPVAQVLALLSLLMPVKTLNNFLGTATSAAGHPGVRLCSQLLILTTTLAAIALGFSHGLERIMTLLLAGHYLILPLLLFNYCRVLPVTPGQTAATTGRHLAIALLAFLLCLLAEDALPMPLEMILLLNCLIFTAGYLSLALAFSRQDLLRLLSLLRHSSVQR